MLLIAGDGWACPSDTGLAWYVHIRQQKGFTNLNRLLGELYIANLESSSSDISALTNCAAELSLWFVYPLTYALLHLYCDKWA